MELVPNKENSETKLKLELLSRDASKMEIMCYSIGNLPCIK